MIGLQFGTLLGGAVLTETVFAIPGMGRLTVTAILDRDYQVVQAAILTAVLASSWSTCWWMWPTRS